MEAVMETFVTTVLEGNVQKSSVSLRREPDTQTSVLNDYVLINGNGPTVTLSQHKFPLNLTQAMAQHMTVHLKQNEAITSNGIM